MEKAITSMQHGARQSFWYLAKSVKDATHRVLEARIREYPLNPPKSQQSSYSRLYLLSAVRILENLRENRVFVDTETLTEYNELCSTDSARFEMKIRHRFFDFVALRKLRFDKDALAHMCKEPCSFNTYHCR